MLANPQNLDIGALLQSPCRTLAALRVYDLGFRFSGFRGWSPQESFTLEILLGTKLHGGLLGLPSVSIYG